MTTYPTYGYKKDPLDYNHYVIDQDIAPIVRKIFMLARNGMTSTEIGKILTDERTLVPSEIVGNTHTRKDGIKRSLNRNTVKRIYEYEIDDKFNVTIGKTKEINIDEQNKDIKLTLEISEDLKTWLNITKETITWQDILPDEAIQEIQRLIPTITANEIETRTEENGIVKYEDNT